MSTKKIISFYIFET